MKYSVRFTKYALKQLKKMDKKDASLILGYISKHLVDCENPRQYGKALTANHKGKWRYRVGNYRVLAYVDDDKIEILVIEIGHRKSVYK